MPSTYAGLTATKFPKTVADLSFEQQVYNMEQKYTPFLTERAYRELGIAPGEEILADHMAVVAEADKSNNISDENNLLEKNQQTSSCSVTSTIGGRGPVIENNSVTGGSCYPAEKETYFTNKILTTGKYEKIHPALEKGLIIMFRKEGRCGITPGDPCGWTCFGIGSAPGCAGVYVKNRAEAEDVYYKKYWKNHNLDKLPDVISTDIFVAGAGGGTGTTLSRFRTFLKLRATSTPVDDTLIEAVKNYKGDIHNDWLNYHAIILDRLAEAYKAAGTYTQVKTSWQKGVVLTRKNGCHVCPHEPQLRQY